MRVAAGAGKQLRKVRAFDEAVTLEAAFPTGNKASKNI
jgi:hypothetical protein